MRGRGGRGAAVRQRRMGIRGEGQDNEGMQEEMRKEGAGGEAGVQCTLPKKGGSVKDQQGSIKDLQTAENTPMMKLNF